MWRIEMHGTDRQNAAAQDWWYDNNGREPSGHCCLQFVTEGTVTVRRGSTYAVVPTGGAFIFYNGEDSAYGINELCSQRCACEFVTFSGMGLSDHFAMMIEEFGNIIQPKPAAQLLTLVRNLSDRASQHLSADQAHAIPAVYSFVGSLFVILDQAKDVARKPVDKAIHRIVTNPLYPWSIKSVVKDCGCSREHFTRIFSERFSASPADWLNQQRVKHALYLLSHTSMSVADIATQAGFSSTHTMARQVKQESGLAPSQIRSAD